MKLYMSIVDLLLDNYDLPQSDIFLINCNIRQNRTDSTIYKY